MGGWLSDAVRRLFDSVLDCVTTRRVNLHDTHTIILMAVVSVLWGGGVATHYIVRTLSYTTTKV